MAVERSANGTWWVVLLLLLITAGARAQLTWSPLAPAGGSPSLAGSGLADAWLCHPSGSKGSPLAGGQAIGWVPARSGGTRHASKGIDCTLGTL